MQANLAIPLQQVAACFTAVHADAAASPALRAQAYEGHARTIYDRSGEEACYSFSPCQGQVSFSPSSLAVAFVSEIVAVCVRACVRERGSGGG
jgi:hypothetical protein